MNGVPFLSPSVGGYGASDLINVVVTSVVYFCDGSFPDKLNHLNIEFIILINL